MRFMLLFPEAFPVIVSADPDMFIAKNVAIPVRIGRIHGSGWLRSLIHRNGSWNAKIMESFVIYLIGFLRRANSPMIIGI